MNHFFCIVIFCFLGSFLSGNQSLSNFLHFLPEGYYFTSRASGFDLTNFECSCRITQYS